MSIAAKTGYIADFKIGYLQRAIIEHQAEVMGGTDTLGGITGFAVGRLVVLTRLADGSVVITAAGTEQAPVSATSISNATHIIAQSDDSLRNVPEDAIPTEKYTTAIRNILANTATGAAPNAATTTMKSIALYKIINADDIKIIPIGHATISVVR